MGFFSREPVMTAQVAGVIVAVSAIFGFKLTTEQATAVVTVVALIAGLVGRAQVSPVQK